MTDECFDRVIADRLVADLLADPNSFAESGRAYDLLQQFVGGYPLEELRPLFHHSNPVVAGRAVWIASELGIGACIFLDDAIAALEHPDDYVRFFALDIVAVCAAGVRIGDIVHFVRRLGDPDVGVRQKALCLLCRRSDSEVLAVVRRLESDEPSSVHLEWLRRLLWVQTVDSGEFEALMRCPDTLQALYGVAIANKLYSLQPHLLNVAATIGSEECRLVAQHLMALQRIEDERKERRKIRETNRSQEAS